MASCLARDLSEVWDGENLRQRSQPEIRLNTFSLFNHFTKTTHYGKSNDFTCIVLKTKIFCTLYYFISSTRDVHAESKQSTKICETEKIVCKPFQILKYGRNFLE